MTGRGKGDWRQETGETEGDKGDKGRRDTLKRVETGKIRDTGGTEADKRYGRLERQERQGRWKETGETSKPQTYRDCHTHDHLVPVSNESVQYIVDTFLLSPYSPFSSSLPCLPCLLCLPSLPCLPCLPCLPSLDESVCVHCLASGIFVSAVVHMLLPVLGLPSRAACSCLDLIPTHHTPHKHRVM